MNILVPLIPLLPLAGFAITGLLGRQMGRESHQIAVWAVVASWVVASVVAFGALTHGFGIGDGFRVTLWTWIPALAFKADMGFYVDAADRLPADRGHDDRHARAHLLDRLHAHDPGKWRFFAYLNLFMFSMLLLVLADNFLLVFAGWELVGLCSYLLIGFWYPRRSPRPRRPRRPSWSTASATWASPSGSWPSGPSSARSTCRTSSSWSKAAGSPRTCDRRRRAAALLRRRRQERPVPAPRLAAGRDGRPHPGLRPHPRRHHGQRRRLPHCPLQPDLRGRTRE